MSRQEGAYVHNPGFKKLIADTGLAFQPHAEFLKADLDARQALYRAIAERIWSPDLLLDEV